MTTSNPPERCALHELDRVELLGEFAEACDRLGRDLLGSREWVRRKPRELRPLFALAQIAPHRMRIAYLDARTDIRAVVVLRCAVPCRAAGETDVRVEQESLLAIRYPEAILRGPLPGTALVEILRPGDVHLPNVAVPAASATQRLCLGTYIPRGLPLREIVLMSYAALTGQTIQLDERDPAGVLNLEAAQFWQHNTHRIPLSRTPFLATEDAS